MQAQFHKESIVPFYEELNKDMKVKGRVRNVQVKPDQMFWIVVGSGKKLIIHSKAKGFASVPRKDVSTWIVSNLP